MTILAQHGWGKSDKIQRGISDGSIQGVIMSPRDESPANLESFLSSMPTHIERMVDPQFHVGILSPARDGKLPDYDHYRPNFSQTSFNTASIRQYVADTLLWQRTLNISAVISPTVMVDQLGGVWDVIAMMMANETIAQHDGEKPLLIGVVLEESTIRQRPLVDDWLNQITTLDVDGFYLTIKRESADYRQQYDEESLTSLIHICYSLGALNDYRVYLGYTDMVTLLLHAVGVTGTASGWSLGLRQFTWRRFLPATIARRPRARYSSSPLLNSIHITTLDTIHSVGRLQDALSGTPHDTVFNGPTNPENVNWPDDLSTLHHWCVLNGIAGSVLGTSIGNRLDIAQNRITQAQIVYNQLGPLVQFDFVNGPSHLEQWSRALNRFRSEAAV